ncbi:MAG: hypothetical protein KGI97_06060 [Alphaproteobacteria bacterium]|nr:hypothetical protein [Alphaproteobacteria bacterium]
MNETPSLPIQIQRGAQIRIIGFAMVVFPLLLAPILFEIMRKTPHMPPVAAYLVPCLLIVFDLFSFLILVKASKPAQISISRTSVTETFIPVFGLNSAPPINRSMAEFDRIEAVKIKGSKGAGTFWLVLRGKDGKPDIRFPAPDQKNASIYARQLGEMLNLKVSDNA